MPKQYSNPEKGGYLPRQGAFIAVPFDGSMGLVEEAKLKLGDRLKEDRLGFRLDGRPVNTDAVLAAAGLKTKDQDR